MQFLKFLFGLLFMCAVVVNAQKVRWVSTTDSVRWQTRPMLRMTKIGGESRDSMVVIDITQKAQRITGWGGCFNELGWKALESLEEDDRKEVLRSLFDQRVGCRFNICRTPMGASDFAMGYYSYDDSVGDYSLKYFSLERDKQLLIPYIKAALSVNPKLTVWASPWTPPAWMKTNGKYNKGTLTPDSITFATYSNYQAKYVFEYAKQGIKIDAIHPQNEPFVASNYPSCLWKSGDTMLLYYKKYLIPTFLSKKVPAKIWLGTNAQGDTGWFKTILDDGYVRGHLSGVGLQYSGLKAAGFLKQHYGIPMMETETPCQGGKNNWKDGESLFNSINGFIKGGCEAYSLWNMVLDETGKSSWGWRQNSCITIDTKAKKAIYNPEFYVMKHFSAFVSIGAYLLKPIKENSNMIFFQNPDGNVVAVVANKEATAKRFSLCVGEKFVCVELEAKSVNTLLIGK